MSKSTDVHFGRRGGGWLDPGTVLPTSHFAGTPVLATCPHGDMAWVMPAAIGQPCDRDGRPLRKATAKEAAARGLSLTFANPLVASC